MRKRQPGFSIFEEPRNIFVAFRRHPAKNQLEITSSFQETKMRAHKPQKLINAVKMSAFSAFQKFPFRVSAFLSQTNACV
jgi:hypothetical protein